VAHADVAQYLSETQQSYDLVLAADVFIYVGALDRVFAGVARVMPPGGVFCFSVEACEEGPDLALRPSLRYAHSPGYIRKLAGQYGFEVQATAGHSIREDQGIPIPGIFAWLVRR
jgi:predicted TPR repeat methyltransferase